MNISILCQLNNGCMGCCGHDFGTDKSIKQAITKNTMEFKHRNPQTKGQFLSFRDRRKPMDLRKGVCRNLIEEDKVVLCPLHPARLAQDLRKGHCDTDHFCNTARKFGQWEETKQQQFLDFIESKKLDNIRYSVMMDNGELLEEFEKV